MCLQKIRGTSQSNGCEKPASKIKLITFEPKSKSLSANSAESHGREIKFEPKSKELTEESTESTNGSSRSTDQTPEVPVVKIEEELVVKGTFVCVVRKQGSAKDRTQSAPASCRYSQDMSSLGQHSPLLTPNACSATLERVARMMHHSAPEQGTTCMWLGIANFLGARPLLRILDLIGELSVSYFYVPMMNWNPRSPSYRNKGYAFIHFTDDASVKRFAAGLAGARGLGECTLANQTGVRENARALLGLPGMRNRTSQIAFYVRFDSTPVYEKVQVSILRKFLKHNSGCTAAPRKFYPPPSYWSP